MKPNRRDAGKRRRVSRGPRRRGLRLSALAAGLGLVLIAGACGGSNADTASAPSPSPTKSTARISISPSNGLRQAKPQNGITVKVAGGTVAKIRVTTDGAAVSGQLNAAKTTWKSRWALATDAQYVVRVTAADSAGRTRTRTARFHTLKPRLTASIQIFEGHNVTYGVGMPVTLAFSRPVEDKEAVERAIALTSSRRIVGAWYWNGDSALLFRPRVYWPEHTNVSFAGHFDGVEIAPGVYATHTLRQDFKIGRSLIVEASASTHKMQVYEGGHRFATWPISTGMPGKETPNGTYLSIEKANPQHMVGPGYDIQVPYSVRFTWSGDFIHAAPWSVGSQGFANVSHGCVNVAPGHAQTYYGMSIPGDPVTITGSPKPGEWDNGWTVWFLSWKQLLKGNAQHLAVRVGPDGSTWVRPASLKKSHAKAPLAGPAQREGVLADERSNVEEEKPRTGGLARTLAGCLLILAVVPVFMAVAPRLAGLGVIAAGLVALGSLVGGMLLAGHWLGVFQRRRIGSVEQPGCLPLLVTLYLLLSAAIVLFYTVSYGAGAYLGGWDV